MAKTLLSLLTGAVLALSPGEALAQYWRFPRSANPSFLKPADPNINDPIKPSLPTPEVFDPFKNAIYSSHFHVRIENEIYVENENYPGTYDQKKVFNEGLYQDSKLQISMPKGLPSKDATIVLLAGGKEIRTFKNTDSLEINLADLKREDLQAIDCHPELYEVKLVLYESKEKQAKKESLESREMIADLSQDCKSAITERQRFPKMIGRN